MKKNLKTKMINVRMEIKDYENFKNFCKKNGYSISKRIRILMKNDYENGK